VGSARAPPLPRPSSITASRKWFGTCKVLELTFKCPVSGYEFKFQSASWAVWLRASAHFVKFGASIKDGDVVGGVEAGMEAIQKLYDVLNANTTEQEEFKALKGGDAVRLSSEQADLLHRGLQEAGFFNKFRYVYDPQLLRGDWIAKEGASASSASESVAEDHPDDVSDSFFSDSDSFYSIRFVPDAASDEGSGGGLMSTVLSPDQEQATNVITEQMMRLMQTVQALEEKLATNEEKLATNEEKLATNQEELKATKYEM
jgi:hypothetical protein